ncbi:CDP-glucose 4%2C6-dehydratase [Candidatus Venteria ishoeyi]|uniref:CDP-glucose 4,6-dehydratase n=2 Tax=Candidatus Venteria ishoeyi TaxID=1899563 RepID=A0A1H6F529_9GAMM|nr:CDP-glucose 4%2C6-dehydratase [Candidatus Venteria ishoeyi]
MDKAFWKHKKVLVTGHTGFKGSWLCLWLQHLGACVTGLALEPSDTPALFEVADVAQGMDSIIGDICNPETVKKVFQQYRPDIVFHLAAQPLVRYAYQHPVETYETNVMGSLHVLEAVRATDSVQAVVMITTDKCYENREWYWPYRENEALGGYDPYSSSKACAELLIASYRQSFFSTQTDSEYPVAIASARAGNVIGGGDRAADRLIPDIIHALQHKQTLLIRNPDAVRPWQHVLEALAGYLQLAEKLYQEGANYAEAWNFGPYEQDAKSVAWIVKRMTETWGDKLDWQVESDEQPHEACSLKLDCSKAHEKLQWQPKWNLQQALEKITQWHRAELNGDDLRQCCLQQIKTYMNTPNQ